MNNVIERGGDAFGRKQRERHHDHTHRTDHRKGHQPVELFRSEHAHHTDCNGNQRSRQEPEIMQALRRGKLWRENQRIDTDDRIGTHLCHNREESSHGCRGFGIARRQPEVQRHKRSLDCKHKQQEHGSDTDANGFLGADERNTLGQIGHIECACLGIDRSKRKQKERRTDQIEQHILNPCPHPCVSACVDHQAVGGYEQHLKENKEVEQIARQESADDAHELKLEQGMKMSAAIVPARTDSIEQHKQRENARQQDHKGRERISDEHNAKGCGPVTQTIERDCAIRRLQRKRSRNHNKRHHTRERKGALNADMIARRQHDKGRKQSG